jgi:hypothetical protein
MLKLYTWLFAAAPISLWAQGGLVNNGAFIRVDNSAHFRVDNGGILNASNGRIANSGTVYLDGNYTENTGATYTAGATNWLTFENAAAVQTLTMTSSLPRLRVDNNNILELGAPLTVTDGIDFMLTGKVRLGNFDLTAPNVALNNYTDVGYVVTNGAGSLKQTLVAGDIKEFPVGNSTYNPVILLSNGGADDIFAVRIEDQVLEGGTSGAGVNTDIVARTYHIAEAAAGGNDMDILVEWGEAEEVPTFSRALSGIAHWNGTSWDIPTFSAATAGAATRWTQSLAGQTSFSPFIVLDNTSALAATFPIELLGFDAERKANNRVYLDWRTGSELNNRGFYIERMLEGETEFSEVGFIEGFGTTDITTNYSFVDENAATVVSYYRLRQVDLDEKVSFSPVRAVRGLEVGTESALLYPNPTKGDIILRFGSLSAAQTSANIRLVAFDGKVLQEFTSAAASYELLEIPTQNLVKGQYLLHLNFNDGTRLALPFVRE